MTQQEIQSHFDELHAAWKATEIQHPGVHALHDMLFDFDKWIFGKTPHIDDYVKALRSLAIQKRHIEGLLAESENYDFNAEGVTRKVQ